MSREIAVFLVVSVLLASLAFVLLGSPDKSAPARPVGPFLPPTTSRLHWPTRDEDCEAGRWRHFHQFRDESACRAYVGYGTP
jgi:hypothetical protein